MTVLSRCLLVLGVLLAGACAQQPAPYTPPAERPTPTREAPWPKNHFLVLGYHDVEDDIADQRYLSVRTSALNEQISWLLHNGYHAVSVQDIIDAHASRKTLPPKALPPRLEDDFT